MKIQLALDFLKFKDALKIAKQVKDYIDWIEAGTPLIKSEGIEVVSEFDQATLASLVNGQGTKPEECPDGRMKVKKRYFRAGLIEQ